MYICDRCDKLIAVTTEDPLVWTRLGKMHFRCMSLAMREGESVKANNQSTAQRLRREANELPDLLPENGFEKIGPPGGSDDTDTEEE
jgi:hypothetical protein